LARSTVARFRRVEPQEVAVPDHDRVEAPGEVLSSIPVQRSTIRDQGNSGGLPGGGQRVRPARFGRRAVSCSLAMSGKSRSP
jgi:hypothetical protein